MDALKFVMETYSKEIEKYFEGTNNLTVSFFADSDSLVDEIKKEKRNVLRYGQFEVKILQDYSIKEKEAESISDFNYCKMDKYKFIKVVTPFTHERAYDFLIGKTSEMEAILKMLKEREAKKNFKYNGDYPVIGFNFDTIEEETIKFLMNEDFRDYCKTKYIKLKRGIILQGRPGCLSRDTNLKIRTKKKPSAQSYTIEDAYHKFNRIKNEKINKRNFWKKEIPKLIQSVVDNKLVYKEIEEIIISGEKEVFELITESGKKIKCTNEHPFKIPKDKIKGRGIKEKDDFVKLEDLIIGEEIFCKNTERKKIYKKKRRSKRKEISGINFHPYAWEKRTGKYVYKRTHFSRLVMEAAINNLTVSKYINILKYEEKEAAKLSYLLPEQIVHHKDEDPMNDILENLEVLSKKEHDSNHTKNEYFSDVFPILEKIISIVKVGVEPTYDIIMKDSANFVANEIIVHNTGKTLTLQWLRNQAEKNGITYRQFKDVKQFVEDIDEYYENGKKIFVFEDFDAALMERKETGNTPNQILGKVLNTLEGVEEINDVVSIFTTNNINVFDSAFIRPGRIDRVFSYDLPTKKEYLEFFKAYIPEEENFFTEMADHLDYLNADVSYAILKGICDDINIYKFSGKSLTKKVLNGIIKRKVDGANKSKEVKSTADFTL